MSLLSMNHQISFSMLFSYLLIADHCATIN